MSLEMKTMFWKKRLSNKKNKSKHLILKLVNLITKFIIYDHSEELFTKLTELENENKHLKNLLESNQISLKW